MHESGIICVNKLFWFSDVLYHQSSGPPYFSVALNLCQTVSQHSEIGGKCGSNAELQVVEMVDACQSFQLTQAELKERYYCWSIRQAKNPILNLNDKSDPSVGASILFGNLSCCPQNGTDASDPGTIGQIPIRIILEPPSRGCNDHDLFEIVKSRTSDFRAMLDCSLLQGNYFDIVVETSRLCPANIDYALNVSETYLSCHVDKLNRVNCTVFLHGRNASVTSDSVCSFDHFQVQLKSSDNSEIKYLSEFSVNNTNRCTFSVAVDSLEAVIVTYSFEPFVSHGNISGSPYLLSLSHSKSRFPYLYIAGGGGLILIILVFIVVYCVIRRHKTRSTIINDSERRRGDSELQDQGSVDPNGQEYQEKERDYNTANSDLRQMFLGSAEHAGSPATNGYEYSQTGMTRFLVEQKPLVMGQLVSKDEFLAEGKYHVCVIRRQEDTAWVADNLTPLFECYDLAVCDIYTPQENTDLGRLFSDFIISAINSSSCFLIVCSPETEKSGDFPFKFAVSHALHNAVSKDETAEKLRVILVNDKKESIPEDLQIFTFIDWAEESQRELLKETFKSIAERDGNY